MNFPETKTQKLSSDSVCFGDRIDPVAGICIDAAAVFQGSVNCHY